MYKNSLFYSKTTKKAVKIIFETIQYLLIIYSNYPLGKVTPGLPKPQPPSFETIVGERTYTAGQMLSHLGTGLIVVPMIGILSNVAIAKAFGKFIKHFLKTYNFSSF